jgi:hypothetical protein
MTTELTELNPVGLRRAVAGARPPPPPAATSFETTELSVVLITHVTLASAIKYAFRKTNLEVIVEN